MLKPTLYACTLLSLGCAALAPALALAEVDLNLIIGTAPPPLRIARIPPPCHGQVWVPGDWNWNGHRHIWASGHWEADRQDYQATDMRQAWKGLASPP